MGSSPTCRAPSAPSRPRAMKVHDLPTPSLLVDVHAFDRNVATMAKRWPGLKLRPHVKAFKSTALAARLAEAGHRGFCCATVREMMGMAAAGLGDDLLLANESLDLTRLTPAIESGLARITVAVDSEATIDAAAKAHIPEVLIDVSVGMPRCGCDPADAGRLADLARAKGMAVRGRDGLRGPPHAGAGRHEARSRRALDGAAPRGGRRRRRRRRVRRRHRARGTSTRGSPSCRPARTA